MYNNSRILALIPARGGSKGIPGKNIRDLNGKPLIAYTVCAARNSKYIDKVVVSTDSQEIASVAQKYGAEIPFLRPAELATDTSKSIDSMIHCIKSLSKMGENFDTVLLLQPTSPLRDSMDIDAAIETFYRYGGEGLVSVSAVDDHPILIRSLNEKGELRNLLNQGSTYRRQDMPRFYRVNGAIYIYSSTEILKGISLNDGRIPYIMEKKHSVDIDSLSDFYLADYYLKETVASVTAEG